MAPASARQPTAKPRPRGAYGSAPTASPYQRESRQAPPLQAPRRTQFGPRPPLSAPPARAALRPVPKVSARPPMPRGPPRVGGVASSRPPSSAPWRSAGSGHYGISRGNVEEDDDDDALSDDEHVGADLSGDEAELWDEEDEEEEEAAEQQEEPAVEDVFDAEDVVDEDSSTAAAAAGDESSMRRKGFFPKKVIGGQGPQKWEPWEKAPTKKERRVLPIQEKRDDVIPALFGEATVCCLVGETGSGKSTQVPQIILEESRARGNHNVRIAVTQPRRVAALNLARRVAEELGEWKVGKTVGYRIGGESTRGWNIDFCTVGYLLQLFLHAPDEFGEYTHVILDEVHERSAESDMLCLVVRLLIASRYPDTRVVVMSATLQSDLFTKYFARPGQPPPAQVYVGARCFPVTEYYLEELSKCLGRRLKTDNLIQQRIRDAFSGEKKESAKGGGKGGQQQNKGNKRVDTRHCEKYHAIILELVEVIAEPGSTILVFLPGIAEISALWEEARQLEEDLGIRVFPLHSMIPREEQEMVFQEPAPDTTNVVLATDIAESSITLPSVVAVIDIGLHRRVDYNAQAGSSALATKWISKAAAKQRAGRAGRTQPGICLRLYTKQFHEDLPDFEPPESASMPLDRLYLQAKQLAEKLSGVLDGPSVPKTAQGLLSNMVQPPSLASIGAARDKNAELGMITAPNEETSAITSLGRLALQLPIDLRLARLIWFGSLMGVAADAVVLASVLSSMDPFSSPSPLFVREERVFLEKLRASTSARLLFDGGLLSEPLMHRQLFLEWMSQFHEKEWVYGDKERVFQARRRFTNDFSWRFSLHRGRMEHVISHILDTSLRVFRATGGASGAAKLLRGLVRGLGYVVNERGDLSGISWEAWREFKPEQVFESNTGYLKALIAMSFGDQLFIGGFGTPPQSLDLKPADRSRKKSSASSNIDRAKHVLEEMARAGLKVRQTAVFGSDAPQDIGAYIELICGDRPYNEVMKINDDEVLSLVPLNEVDSSRWQPLASRESAPLLDCPRRLPAEFNLLAGFEKSMKDMQRAKSMSGGGWSYGVVPVQHPCLLRWEWMHQGTPAKNAPIPRCEGMFDRKNAVGFIGSIPNIAPGERLRRIASLAVASQVTGAMSPQTAYPMGVTVLSPGHIAFILVSAHVNAGKNGFSRFGFATNGSVTVLHRTLELPAGCVDKIRWTHIGRLREALRAELVVPEAKPADGAPWRTLAPALLGNSDVADLSRTLFDSVPTQDGGEEAHADSTFDGDPLEALRWTVDLQGASSPGPEAFRPLADWEELKKRREELVKKGGREFERKREREGRRLGESDRPRSTRNLLDTLGVAGSRRDAARGDVRRPARPREEERGRRRRDEPDDRRRDDRRDEERPQPVSMSLYELCRTVALRCCAAANDAERDRLMIALNSAVSSGKWSAEESRKVRRRRAQAEDMLRNRPRDAPRESGRTILLDSVEELERRLVALVGREDRSDRHRSRTSDRHEPRRASVDGRSGRDGRSERGRSGGALRRGSFDERQRRDEGRSGERHRFEEHRGGGRRSRSRSARPSSILDASVGTVTMQEQEVEWVDGCYPWVRVRDPESGGFYYFNEETSESTWDHPAGLDDAA